MIPGIEWGTGIILWLQQLGSWLKLPMAGFSFLGTEYAYLFLLPSTLVLALFLVYPILWSLLASFREIGLGDLMDIRLWSLPGTWTGIENYRALFGDALFRKSLLNTAYFA